jgi:o-succinylbenzoate synthase
MKFSLSKHNLKYKKPVGTSRGVLTHREVFLLEAIDNKGNKGLGECGIIPGLSIDDVHDYEQQLVNFVELLNTGKLPDPHFLKKFPSIAFAYECAMLNVQQGGKQVYYDTPYTQRKAGIPINGLVWMEDLEEMWQEAQDKIKAGFECIKLKIGFHEFDAECRLLEKIRKFKPASRLELRVDANGAYAPDDALKILKELKRFELHSIEQPIKAGQWEAMGEICAKSPVPVALDEELIGLDPESSGNDLIKKIKPQWLVLKPGLLGGFGVAEKWIKLAQNHQTGWWATSALESNVGLDAIAQWVSTFDSKMYQGLGTGQLYEQNFKPETEIVKGVLWRGV